jgi:RHS repeat-associated protein
MYKCFTQIGFEAYRYGFNGKENDNEVKGQGNQQDYGMRIYDPRLVKFLSMDPLIRSYPWYTPYQFAGNKVI